MSALSQVDGTPPGVVLWYALWMPPIRIKTFSTLATGNIYGEVIGSSVWGTKTQRLSHSMFWLAGSRMKAQGTLLEDLLPLQQLALAGLSCDVVTAMF